MLVTGTHENTPQVVNTLYGEHGVVRTDTWQRLPGSYHGSGCTLASAIAATIAHGLDVAEAVRDAQEYTWQTLKAGFRPGMGQYIPDRLFWARETTKRPAGEMISGPLRHHPRAARHGASAATGACRRWRAARQLVQYRNKSRRRRAAPRAGQRAAALCRAFDVPLIVNDDLRLADLSGADGVHLGRDDGDLARGARRCSGAEKLLGVSCYDDLDWRSKRKRGGADYVAFGSFFPSADQARRGARAAGRCCARRSAALGVPVVAIGGITPTMRPR